MLSIKTIMNGDGCWPDLLQNKQQIIHLANDAPPIEMAMLKNGTVRGKPSVTIRLNLPDGRVVLAETTLALLVSAAKAFEAASSID